MIVVLLLFATIPRVIAENQIFFDDFESYEVGSVPTNWKTKAESTESPGVVKVVSGIYRSPSKSLMVLGSTYFLPGGGVKNYKQTAFRTFHADADIITCELQFKSDYPWPIFIEFWGKGKVTEIYFCMVESEIDNFPDVHGVYDGHRGEYLEFERSLFPNWYKIQMTVDLQSAEWSVSIEDFFEAKDLGIRTENLDGGKITSIRFTAMGKLAEAYFDDVKVFKGSQPPTNQKAIPSISASSTTILEGENVRFDASASYDPDGSVVSYWFDYGDGTNSGWTSDMQKYKVYSESGEYNAKIKVKDNQGLESDWTKIMKITVTSRPTTKTTIEVKSMAYDEWNKIYLPFDSKDAKDYIDNFVQNGHPWKNYGTVPVDITLENTGYNDVKNVKVECSVTCQIVLVKFSEVSIYDNTVIPYSPLPYDYSLSVGTINSNAEENAYLAVPIKYISIICGTVIIDKVSDTLKQFELPVLIGMEEITVQIEISGTNIDTVEKTIVFNVYADPKNHLQEWVEVIKERVRDEALEDMMEEYAKDYLNHNIISKLYIHLPGKRVYDTTIPLQKPLLKITAIIPKLIELTELTVVVGTTTIAITSGAIYGIATIVVKPEQLGSITNVKTRLGSEEKVVLTSTVASLNLNSENAITLKISKITIGSPFTPPVTRDGSGQVIYWIMIPILIFVAIAVVVIYKRRQKP